MDAILVFISAGSEGEAQQITERLLSERLVACVNQTAHVRSEFWWKGERDSADEVLLLAKSRRELWPQVLAAVRAVHSYDVFEAIAVPIIEGSPDYLRWIEETTQGESE